MTLVANHTPLKHAWFRKTGLEGEEFDVLVVKGSFAFGQDGALAALTERQDDILFGDAFAGPVETEPLKAVIRDEGDLVLFKPGTDIQVTGAARAAGGVPVASWQASVQVGTRRKTLRLSGPRWFERGRALGWRLTPAERIALIDLDYRLAFGGLWQAPGTSPDEAVYKPDNPAGRGWLPGPADLKGLPREARRALQARIDDVQRLPAPQIESAERPVRDPRQHVPTEGFGPMARWCQPRKAYAGTYDAAWEKDRYPLLPTDFDFRYYQAAHPGLVCADHLVGGEMAELAGLLPEGTARMRLPRWRLLAMGYRASGEQRANGMLLDTVRFDLDTRRLHLVWRTSFAVDDPVQELILSGQRVEVPA